MADANGPLSRVRFGAFEADINEGALWKRGVRVQIQRQPFEILAALLARPNEIITREELRQRIWSNDTFVDFEHRLNAAVNKLRQALVDSADKPRYIETVPGRGYRFIADAEGLQPSLDNPAVMNAPQSRDSPVELLSKANDRISSRTWVLLGLGLVVGFVAGWLLPRTLSPQAPTRMVQFSVAAPSGLMSEPAFAHQDFAISPDGSRLAFLASDLKGSQLWLHDLATAKSFRVTPAQNVQSVEWSYDGTSLFFDEQFTVRRLPSSGGPSVVVCEIPSGLALNSLLNLSNDLLLFTRTGKAFRVPLTGGVPAAALRKDLQYLWPQALPSGDLLHVSFDHAARGYQAWVTSPNRPANRKALVATDSRVQYSPALVGDNNGYLLYIKAGTLVAQPFDTKHEQVSGRAQPVAENVFWFEPTGAAAFSASQNGVLAYKTWQSSSQLKWVDRRGQTIGTIGKPQSFLTPFRLSPDGTKLAAAFYDPRKGGTDIWIYDLMRHLESRLTQGAGQVASPIWAPDTNRLAFLHAVGGPPKLHWTNISESRTEHPLATSDVFQLPTDWSHDGRFLLYQTSGSIGPPKAGIILLDLAHGAKRIVLSQSAAQELDGMFSPDDSLIAFLSTETGRAEAYIQSFETEPEPHLAGQPLRVSNDGATLIRWPRESKELFYLNNENQVMAVRIERRRGRLVVGKPQKLFYLETAPQILSAGGAVDPGFDISADGQRFIIPELQQPRNSPFVVIENWQKLIEH
jgi:DNA-binding winged helix-turn-helix (wHTH) protein/Tol biopolymer transport system component